MQTVKLYFTVSFLHETQAMQKSPTQANLVRNKCMQTVIYASWSGLLLFKADELKFAVNIMAWVRNQELLDAVGAARNSHWHVSKGPVLN